MKKKNAYFTLCLLQVMAILYLSPIQMSDLPTEFKHPLPSWRGRASLPPSPCLLFLHKCTYLPERKQALLLRVLRWFSALGGQHKQFYCVPINNAQMPPPALMLLLPLSLCKCV